MVLATAIFLSALLQQDTLSSQELYKRSLPSIMTLHVQKRDGTAVLGTGFLALKEGVAVTAWHVVNGAQVVKAKFSDGEEFESSGLIDKDEQRDIALIRVRVVDRPLLPTSSTAPEVASKAYVIGAPRGLDFSITDGLVSQVRTTC